MVKHKVRESVPLSKIDRNRFNGPVKTSRPSLSSPSGSRTMLNIFCACASCLDQKRTEITCLLFDIQTIGIKQEGPLLTKEALWKR